MVKKYEIFGDVSPGYEAVRDEFEKNFEAGKEDKCQCCVYVKGVKVVDIWGRMKPASGATSAKGTEDTTRQT